GVPNDGHVVVAAGDDRLAVGGEIGGANGPFVTGKRQQQFAGGNVVDLRRLVVRCGENTFAVGREGRLADARLSVAEDWFEDGAVGGVPESRRTVVAGGEELRAV